MQCMLQEKHSLKVKVVKESIESSEIMFEHMMKITKLEIKSTIKLLNQINGEDQDMLLVEAGVHSVITTRALGKSKP